MRAIGYFRSLPIEDPESLLDLDIPKPTPTGCDVLVRVRAISVNPVDVKVRAHRAPEGDGPSILGWDAAGVIEAVGSDAHLFQPGDEVYYAGAIDRPGANSEYHLIDERLIARKPATLDDAEAAALPLTSLTAWEALFDRMGVVPQAGANAGRTILIIGAAGGVGSIATQIAHWAGLTVIGTASRPESQRWISEHGAHQVIGRGEPLAQQVARLGFRYVDYILCLNSPDSYWDDMASLVAPQGKICSILDTIPSAEAAGMLTDKSATLVWEYMYTRSLFQTDDMAEQGRALTRIAELVDSGAFKTTLTERLTPITAANLREAHRKVESGAMIGKVVLEGFPA